MAQSIGDPTQLSLAGASRAITEGALSPVALTEGYLDRIAALDGELHSYVLVLTDEALTAAMAAEADIRAGRSRGKLHGIPIGLKDIYKTRGIRTTAGSRVYLDHVPEEDAETWVRLHDAGAILLGKQETHEFAIGGPDFTLPFPPARNPWNTEHYPAGSSSGTAAAVGAHLCAAGMGSDTGGSIRGPAAYCGIVGLKPTYGRLSRRGVFPLSYTLDHCGPLTRTVEDCAWMLQALAGHDPKDPASVDMPVPDYARALTPRIDGLSIGVIRHWHEEDAVAGFGPESTPSPAYIAAFDAACRTLESLGARLRDIRLSPLLDYADTNRLIMLSEAFALHETDFRERPHLFGRQMFARIGLGAFLSAADYVEAMRQRRELCLEMAGALGEVDLIVSANYTGPAPRIDAVGTWGVFERASYTAPYNITGLPALSVPIGFEDALPLAFQIAARPFDEAGVLRAGFAFEQAAGIYRQQPPMAASLPAR
ncbi:MAG TPA: amidase [Stellaceae bacterium]|jgi:aspartyl-tRNA(Asn)/glutamyl-tRNA(Gln) amidotransferase subunit A|nr:amidase [Stellaceae bacterium]